jgi:hypothetical protein
MLRRSNLASEAAQPALAGVVLGITSVGRALGGICLWPPRRPLTGVGIGLAAGRALGARFPSGGELLVHTPAARFQRGGQARAQLAEELVVRT